jgi:hypothetical protein
MASCHRASAVGQRDRAILLLLARLGLRAELWSPTFGTFLRELSPCDAVS